MKIWLSCLNIKPDGSIAQIRFRILMWAIFLRSGKRRECLWQKKTDERVTDEKVVEIEMEIF